MCLCADGRVCLAHSALQILQEALDLPDCLDLVSARANKVQFRFQLMKYKTEPIVVQIDRIDVRVDVRDDGLGANHLTRRVKVRWCLVCVCGWVGVS